MTPSCFESGLSAGQQRKMEVTTARKVIKNWPEEVAEWSDTVFIANMQFSQRYHGFKLHDAQEPCLYDLKFISLRKTFTALYFQAALVAYLERKLEILTEKHLSIYDFASLCPLYAALREKFLTGMLARNAFCNNAENSLLPSVCKINNFGHDVGIICYLLFITHLVCPFPTILPRNSGI